MTHATTAVAASTTNDMTFCSHTIADLYATNTRSYLYGYTYKFVTHDIGWGAMAL
jgi:hypothetical protein